MILEKIPGDESIIYRLKFEGQCVGTTEKVSKKVGEVEGNYGINRDLFVRTTKQAGQSVWFKLHRMTVVLNLGSDDKHILLLKKA
jgi:hypothetical protein